MVGYFKDKKNHNYISFNKVVLTIRKIDENYLRGSNEENKEFIKTSLKLPTKIRLTLGKINEFMEQQ